MDILYVEDNARYREVAAARFLCGHAVTFASTLQEARSLLTGRAFDAVLLDYDLPDGKGISLIGTLKHRQLLDRTVAVSSRDENNALLVAAGVPVAVSKMRFSELSAVLEALSTD